jgi:DNA (cytosine-5)-methyltransferase 1
MNNEIPVIDLFAGPGGLGEGFSSISYKEKPIFKVALSIEKDEIAHKTLSLRALFREFRGAAPQPYYDYITGKISRDELFKNKSIKNEIESSSQEAKNVTLGETSTTQIDKWIKHKISGKNYWVLIGGPPCQAYSLVGRSKMMNSDLKKYETDNRHLLYKEYLRIIQVHKPPVFIMENVKGILSSKLNNSLIFNQIKNDLENPLRGLNYEIRSLVVDSEDLAPTDYIIKSEQHGIPQARHRVILFGVRKDLAQKKHKLLNKYSKSVTVSDAISDLPIIRSRLSKEFDSHKTWVKALNETNQLVKNWKSPNKQLIVDSMKRSLLLSEHCTSHGSEFVEQIKPNKIMSPTLKSWFHDPRIGGVIQHSSRSHIKKDIQRYFFLSNYSEVTNSLPKVTELPENLLPHHKNVSAAKTPFTDRFRVQYGNLPSTTVVAHISKDGHYYIHPNSFQARSLTLREAARLQTFPDNYFFEGTRTQQYVQVGNAVPPLLAKQIAEIVAQFLDKKID